MAQTFQTLKSNTKLGPALWVENLDIFIAGNNTLM